MRYTRPTMSDTQTPLQPGEKHFPKVDKAHWFVKDIIERILFKLIGVERNAKIAHKPIRKGSTKK